MRGKMKEYLFLSLAINIASVSFKGYFNSVVVIRYAGQAYVDDRT